MEKRKIDFDTPEWQEYFKGKSPEEIEEIKKLFEEKKEIPRRSSGAVEKICPDCGGTGKKISSSGKEEICPRCQGTAGIEVESDKLYQLEKKREGVGVTGFKDLFKPKNKLEEELNKTTLSAEERKKIYEEEKARIEAKKKLEAEQNAKNFGSGCAGLIGLIILIAIGVSVFQTTCSNPTPTKKSSTSSILMEGRTYTINQDNIVVFNTKDIPTTEMEMLNHLVTVLVKGDKIELLKSGFLASKVVVREHNGQPVYWYGWIPTGLLSKSVK